MENKKIVRKSFGVHQYEEEEIFLSEMRAKGWKFVILHAGLPSRYEFEKCEPEEYIYQLDFVETEKDTPDYHQLYQDSGWDEIFTWPALGGKWYYFVRKKEEGMASQRIYTDQASKITLYNSLWKRYCLLFLVVSIIELNGIRASVSMLEHEGISSFFGIAGSVGIVFFAMIIVYLMYNFVAILAKKRELKKAAEIG